MDQEKNCQEKSTLNRLNSFIFQKTGRRNQRIRFPLVTGLARLMSLSSEIKMGGVAMETIRQVGNGKSYLGEEQLRSLNSLWATSPQPDVSSRYRQVRTMDIVSLFVQNRWFPVMAQEQRVINTKREGFQKHMIRFRQQLPVQKDDIFPEAILTNSHDRSSTYQIMAGIFRLVCMNGMVVSEAEFGTIKVRHMGFEPREIVEATRKFSDELPRIIGKVDDYRKVLLSPSERRIFAESALLTKFAPGEEGVELKRFDDDNVVQIGERQFNTKQLLIPKRVEDQSPSLWNTYNVVQEKLTKGNRFEVDTKNPWARNKKVREIKGINEQVRVNRGLWHLMAEMAKQKGAN